MIEIDRDLRTIGRRNAAAQALDGALADYFAG